MNFSFSMSQMMSHALAYSRANEIRDAIRNLKQLPKGAYFSYSDALSAVVNEKDGIFHSFEGGEWFVEVRHMCQNCDEYSQSTLFAYGLYAQALISMIAWTNFCLSLDQLKRGTSKLAETKALLKTFKQCLEEVSQ